MQYSFCNEMISKALTMTLASDSCWGVQLAPDWSVFLFLVIIRSRTFGVMPFGTSPATTIHKHKHKQQNSIK